MAASNVSTIEHRFQQRIPLHKDVVIYKNCIPIAVGKTQDISSEGMGIYSEASIKKYAVLEIELGVNGGNGKVYRRLSGLVVHHANDRLGILFTGLNPDDTAILDQLMQGR